jgi:hypothetical protein
MKLGIWTTLFFLGFSQSSFGQTNAEVNSLSEENPAVESPANNYVVVGANAVQEASLRAQMEIIKPSVRPLRIVFVPHSKYISTARIFQLHVPSGYTSSMFTHLPSRTTFIDSDRYEGEDWLNYWMAHELGHLATNSTKESDAEKVAHEYRKRMRDAQQARLQN